MDCASHSGSWAFGQNLWMAKLSVQLVLLQPSCHHEGSTGLRIRQRQGEQSRREEKGRLLHSQMQPRLQLAPHSYFSLATLSVFCCCSS